MTIRRPRLLGSSIPNPTLGALFIVCVMVCAGGCGSSPNSEAEDAAAALDASEISPFDDDAARADGEDGQTDSEGDVPDDDVVDVESDGEPGDVEVAEVSEVSDDADTDDDASPDAGDADDDTDDAASPDAGDADDDTDDADVALPDADVDPDAAADPDTDTDAPSDATDDADDAPDCPEGFADCDGDGSCETDLSSPELCGACGPLDGVPGEACGLCSEGVWRCALEGSVFCAGDTMNRCGGCNDLRETPGEACGACGEGVIECDGTERTTCVGESALDSDGDGVPDECDMCPAGDDAADGDEDGVPDDCDCDFVRCSPLAECVESPGARECVCREGYVADGDFCVDRDECADFSHRCDRVREFCVNTDGGYECECADGFAMTEGFCDDIDECRVDNGGCDREVECVNLVGSFVCDYCPEPLVGNGALGCVPGEGVGERCEEAVRLAAGRNVLEAGLADDYPAYEGTCAAGIGPQPHPGFDGVGVLRVPPRHRVTLLPPPDLTPARFALSESCPGITRTCEALTGDGSDALRYINHTDGPVELFVVLDALEPGPLRARFEIELDPLEELGYTAICGHREHGAWMATSTSVGFGLETSLRGDLNHYNGYWNPGGRCGEPHRAIGADEVHPFVLGAGLGVVVTLDPDPNLVMFVTTGCDVNEQCEAAGRTELTVENATVADQPFYLFIDQIEDLESSYRFSISVFEL